MSIRAVGIRRDVEYDSKEHHQPITPTGEFLLRISVVEDARKSYIP